MTKLTIVGYAFRRQHSTSYTIIVDGQPTKADVEMVKGRVRELSRAMLGSGSISEWELSVVPASDGDEEESLAS